MQLGASIVVEVEHVSEAVETHSRNACSCATQAGYIV
jgi:hypothetical protein